MAFKPSTRVVGTAKGKALGCGPATPKLTQYERGKEPVPSLLNHYRGHKGAILALAFHPNLETVFSSSCDGSIMNWNYRKETRALRFEGHSGPVNDISLSAYGDLMVSCSDDCTVRIWVPTVTGQNIVVKGHTAAVRSACFNPADPSRFATGSNDKTVKVWSVQTAKMKSGATKFKNHDFVQSFRNHNNWVNSVRFSPNGELLCSASDDKTVCLFDLRAQACAAKITVPCHLGTPLKAEFNPCGNTYVGVSMSERAFLLYDIRKGQILQSYEELFQGPVNSFSFHPGGDFAVCVSEDSKIKILDLIEGRPIFTLHGPRKGLCAVAFNASGSLFATGGKDQELLVWEPTLVPYDCNSTDAAEPTCKDNAVVSSCSSACSVKTNSSKEKENIDIQIPRPISKGGVDSQRLTRSSSTASSATEYSSSNDNN